MVSIGKATRTIQSEKTFAEAAAAAGRQDSRVLPLATISEFWCAAQGPDAVGVERQVTTS